jgi:hypothetical protein
VEEASVRCGVDVHNLVAKEETPPDNRDSLTDPRPGTLPVQRMWVWRVV